MNLYLQSRYLEKGFLERINLALSLVFLLLFSFSSRYITYLIVLWTIISISIAIKRELRLKEILRKSLPFVIFYGISVISLLYTEDLNRGIKILETQVTFIIMPFLLMVLKESEIRKKMEYIYNAYLIGLLLHILISFLVLIFNTDFNTILKYLEIDSLIGASRYFNLSCFVNPNYISMYLVWGIILIITRTDGGRKRLYILGNVCLAALFLFYIVLLGSRAAILTVIIVAIFYVFRLLRRFPLWVSITGTLLISLLLMILVLKFKRIEDSVTNLQKSDKSITDVRIYLWSDAFTVFLTSPILGYGIGDGETEVIAQHKKNVFIDTFHENSNAHNQYLEIATQTGIVGLLSFITILFVPLINSIRRNQKLLFLLICIIGFNLLFASMLFKLSAVLFLSFWLNFGLIIEDRIDSDVMIDF